MRGQGRGAGPGRDAGRGVAAGRRADVARRGAGAVRGAAPVIGVGPVRGAGQRRGHGRGVRMRGGGIRRAARMVVTDEIRATVIDHVVNHGLSLREAGERVQPNVPRSTVASIVRIFQQTNRYVFTWIVSIFIGKLLYTVSICGNFVFLHTVFSLYCILL